MTRTVGRRTGPGGGALLACALALVLLVGCTGASRAKDTFPKTVNIYFPSLGDADIHALARWDMLVLPKRAQTWHQAELEQLRALNPDIVLLVHMPVGYNGSWTAPEDNAVLTEKLDSADWWLRDTRGGRIMANEQDALLNVTDSCPVDSKGMVLNEWLPEYIAGRLGPGGYWDGAFLDFCMNKISWMNNYLTHPIDIDQDGHAETNAYLNEAWDDGMRAMVGRLRELVGDDYIIVTNGNNDYYEHCDGSTREDFPEMHGDWYDNIADADFGYLAMAGYRRPSANVINTIWSGPSTLGGPVRTPAFNRKFSLTFASTLVFGDGYYSLDGPSHSQIWWHEYFDLELGRAEGGAEHVPAAPGRGGGIELAEMIRVRRFEKGIAAVNPTSFSQELTLPGFYYPPESWNGEFYPHEAATGSVTLESESGTVLVGSGRLLALPSGLRGWRLDGANYLQWPPVDGASAYSVYRVDVGQGVGRTLVDVVPEPALLDGSARTAVSRYFVAPIDETGCEGQLSPPVEVSSVPGSDLSLTLLATGGEDGTLTLSWDATLVPGGCLLDIMRKDAEGLRTVLTEGPIDASATDGYQVEPRPNACLYEAVAVEDGVGGTVVGSVLVEPGQSSGQRLSMESCCPHPVASDTTFELLVEGREPIDTTLTIYDVSGRLVRRLLDGELGAGRHSVSWDGRSDRGDRVASGCYLYLLAAPGQRHSGKLLVVR